MKTLYTACYGRARALPPDFTQVRTSRGIPEWWHPARRIDALPLAPSPQVMSASKVGRPWQPIYRQQLELLYRSGVLEKVIDGLPENSVLLCFESDPRDCHRSILAAYLVEKGIATVKEYVAPPLPVPKKPTPPVDAQLFLL